MFDNISEKIKTAANVICWLGIIANIIAAIVMFVAADQTEAFGLIGLGIALLILGPILSWVFSLFIYGFGELIESNNTIENFCMYARRVLSESEKQNGDSNHADGGANNSAPVSSTSAYSNVSITDGWKCAACGRVNPVKKITCVECGAYRK